MTRELEPDNDTENGMEKIYTDETDSMKHFNAKSTSVAEEAEPDATVILGVSKTETDYVMGTYLQFYILKFKKRF